MTVGEMTREELTELIREVLDQREERRVLVGYKEVSEMTGLSVPTIRKLVNEGSFPPPFLGDGRKGSDVKFLRSDVENLRRSAR